MPVLRGRRVDVRSVGRPFLAVLRASMLQKTGRNARPTVACSHSRCGSQVPTDLTVLVSPNRHLSESHVPEIHGQQMAGQRLADA